MADEAAQETVQDGQPKDNAPTQDAGKTFTQADLDRIVKDRLDRQKAQFEPKLAGLDELKQKAARLDELEESRKSEAERLLGQLDKYKTEAQQAVEREQKAIERANHMLVRSAVVREAARANAVDPDDVYALANAHGLLGGVQIGDDGQVAGADEAVKQLLGDRPHLVGRPSGGFDGGARQSAPVASSRADLNAQIRKAAGFA